MKAYSILFFYAIAFIILLASNDHCAFGQENGSGKNTNAPETDTPATTTGKPLQTEIPKPSPMKTDPPKSTPKMTPKPVETKKATIKPSVTPATENPTTAPTKKPKKTPAPTVERTPEPQTPPPTEDTPYPTESSTREETETEKPKSNKAKSNESSGGIFGNATTILIIGGIGALLIVILLMICCCKRSSTSDKDYLATPAPYTADNDQGTLSQHMNRNYTVQKTVAAVPPQSYHNTNAFPSPGLQNKNRRNLMAAQSREQSEVWSGASTSYNAHSYIPSSYAASSIRSSGFSEVSDDDRSSYASYASYQPSEISSYSDASSYSAASAAPRSNNARSEWLSAVANGNIDAGYDSRSSAKQQLGSSQVTSPGRVRSSSRLQNRNSRKQNRGSFDI